MVTNQLLVLRACLKTSPTLSATLLDNLVPVQCQYLRQGFLSKWRTHKLVNM